MLAVFAVVAPVFALIAIGLVAARSRFLSDGAAKAISEFTFKLAMPALMFRTMATADVPAVSAGGLLVSFFGAVAIVWIATALITRFVLHRPADDGAAIAFSASYGNIVMLGIPLGLSAFGPQAMGLMALIISVNSPLMWLAATLHMGLAQAGGGTQGAPLTPTAFVGSLVRELATNPIIIAIVLGSLWRTTGLGLAVPLDRILTLLGQAGVPMALVALGLSLATFRIAGQLPTLVTIIVAKGIVMPLIAFGLAKAFSLPQMAIGIVVLLAAMPTGANAFLFATRYNRAVNSTSGAIAVGTLLASVVAAAVLWWL